MDKQETPRTDAAQQGYHLGDEGATFTLLEPPAPWDFARTLERELSAALTRIEKLEGDKREILAAIDFAVTLVRDEVWEFLSDWREGDADAWDGWPKHRDLAIARAALEQKS